MIGLRPILIRKRAEHDEKRSRCRGASDQAISRFASLPTLRIGLQEEQRVELARVPDDALAGDEAEQREQGDLGSTQRPNDSVSGAFDRCVPSSFIFWKAGDLLSWRRIQTEMPSSTTDTRNGTRQPQSAKSFADDRAGEENHQQRQEQAEGRGGLDPRGRVEASTPGGVFGHVGRRAAVFAAERQASSRRSAIRMMAPAMPAEFDEAGRGRR